jgi:hypothetical protein
MSTEDIICVVREHRWLSAEQQAKRFRDSGECRVIVSLGGGKRLKQVTRSDLERLARPGTVFRFVYAFLLADTLRNVVAMRSDFEHAVRRLQKRGGEVEDLDSGLTTADEGHKKALMALASHMIGRDRQGARSAKNGIKQRGRSLVEFPPAVWEKAEAIWKNLIDFPRWEDVDEAFEKLDPRFTRYRASRKWGPRKFRKAKIRR